MKPTKTTMTFTCPCGKTLTAKVGSKQMRTFSQKHIQRLCRDKKRHAPRG